MKAVCKKLFSLMLVAILLVSAVPFQASAEEVNETVAPTAATEAAVVETTEAAAAPAAVVEEEITVTTPELAEAVPMTKDVVHVHFQLDSSSETYTVDQNYQVGNIIKTKLGNKVGVPGAAAALNTLAKAIGSSEGYEFVRWEYEAADGLKTFTGNVVLNLDNMVFENGYDEKTEQDIYILNVYAVIQPAAKTITLKPNGGTISSNKHSVKIGETYDYYGGLPTPSRAGYTFAGWFKADGTQVANDTVVTDLSALTANWNLGKYTVVYQGYVGDWDEVGFGSFSVDANSVLKTAYYNFPTDSQIKTMFLGDMAAEGWYIDGWEYSIDDGSSWNTFTAGTTKITGNTIIRPLYKKSITLYACDGGNTTRKLTVTLGKRIPVLPNPGTREGYAFVGWFLEPEASTLVSTKDNLSNVSVHPVYDPNEMGDLYAGWAEATTIYLYIHTNGDTKDHTKLVRYYDAPANGFDLTDIDLYDIFPNYSKYDDKGDEKYGWYNSAQWKNYCLGKHINDTTEYVDENYLSEDDVHEFYIMLIDNGNNTSTGSANGNGYNDNKNTVDSSNPSTGDEIFMAVTVMAVSASVLVLFFLNKKRIAK